MNDPSDPWWEDPKHAKENVLAAFGHLTLSFQALEFACSELLSGLVASKYDEVGLQIASSLSFRLILDLIDTLFRSRYGNPEHLKSLGHILKTASELESKRNTFLHSKYNIYDFVGDSIRLSRYKPMSKRGKGFKNERYEFDPQELINCAWEIKVLVSQIESFVTQLNLESDHFLPKIRSLDVEPPI